MVDQHATERCYSIEWRQGQPHIQVGEIKSRGKKKISRRAVFPGYETTVKSAARTIKRAIEQEILSVASWNSRAHIAAGIPENPWRIVHFLAKLNRLYHKLKKHHLA